MASRYQRLANELSTNLKGWKTQKELDDHGGLSFDDWTNNKWYGPREPYNFEGWDNYQQYKERQGEHKNSYLRRLRFDKDLKERGPAYVREHYPDMGNVGDLDLETKRTHWVYDPIKDEVVDVGEMTLGESFFPRGFKPPEMEEPEDPADFWKKASMSRRAKELAVYQDGLPFEDDISPSLGPFTIEEKENAEAPVDWMNPHHLNENLLKNASRTLRLANELIKLI